ncbi:MAG: hypothetical protein ABI896_03450 [Actinomycetota bacterium]
MATLTNVAAGSYLVVAKMTLAQTDNAQSESAVTCTLDAGGGVTDTSEAEIGRHQQGALQATISFQLAKTFASTGSIVLRCNSAANFSIAARHTSIAAIAVGAATRSAVNG